MWKLKIAEGGEWLTSCNNHVGRQHWEFDPQAGTAEERALVQRLRHEFTLNRHRFKQSSDLLMRMQFKEENSCGKISLSMKVKDTDEISAEAMTSTLQKGISFFSSIQVHDGHWASESAGPLFFLPSLVIALYVTEDVDVVLSTEHQKEIIRYIYNHQNEDGGWGLHIEGHSSLFGSCLNYICLRLLGEEGDEDGVSRGRKWILEHGGALAIPSWGKFWLAVLGAYEWAGCNPIPPESCLLPKLSPIHPAKMVGYCRLVYMPMSYLYGKRCVGPITSLVQSLRQELYNQPYHLIDWNKARNTCSKEDLYYPHPLVQDILWGFLHHVAEPILIRWPFSSLREKALRVVMEHIHYEDENSRYFCIGGVEKALCLLACYVEDPNSEAYKRHLARIPDYLWVAEDGMKMQSFGSQMWDAAFAIQAILSSNLAEEYATTLRKAHEFVKASQVRDNPSGNYAKMYRHTSKGAWTFSIQDHGWQVSDCTADRHTSKGAWTFSIQDHGWQVSDCTAEGIKVSLLFSQMSPELVGEKIETERLYDAVNVLLSLQGSNGGFTAWEPRRAFYWLEKLNPVEIFKDVVVEQEYVECTSSAIQGLALFRKLHPRYRRNEIEECISKAIRYIEKTQNADGSWYGSWGICYTYGTWFAVEGLVACGRNYHNSPTLRKACDFLLSKQLPDGGWGESFLSSLNKVYTNLEDNRSNLVQTSWALLALIDAGQGEVDRTPIDRGIRLLINSQMEDGDFPQQEITGVFFKTCILNYSLYRNTFPIWALAEYRRCVGVVRA